MKDLLDRIVAAAPDPLRLTDDEFVKLSAYLRTHRRPVSLSALQRAQRGDLAERARLDQAKMRWRAWQCTLKYNRELRSASTATGPAQDMAGTNAGKAKGGRPKVTAAEAKKRKALIAEWLRAKGAGESMKGFCQDRGHDLKYLEKCLNWASQQSRRSTTA